MIVTSIARSGSTKFCLDMAKELNLPLLDEIFELIQGLFRRQHKLVFIVHPKHIGCSIDNGSDRVACVVTVILDGNFLLFVAAHLRLDPLRDQQGMGHESVVDPEDEYADQKAEEDHGLGDAYHA